MSAKMSSMSMDEARLSLQMEPQSVRRAAIQSIREAKDQPHLPYSLYREVAVTPHQLKRLPRDEQIGLATMLKLSQERPFMSVCMECGTVIGLHEIPAGESFEQFGRVLFLTVILEKVPCPTCGESGLAFLKSSALVSRLPLERLLAPARRELAKPVKPAARPKKQWWQFWK